MPRARRTARSARRIAVGRAAAGMHRAHGLVRVLPGEARRDCHRGDESVRRSSSSLHESRARGDVGLLAGAESARQRGSRSRSPCAAIERSHARELSLRLPAAGHRRGVSRSARALRRDARARPRRHGRRARSVRFAAAAQRGAQGARSGAGWTTKWPGSDSAARRGPRRRSRTRMSSPCIRSKRRATTACRTW